MKRTVVFISCVLLASAALGQQSIYYCNKGGKKLISDTPCDRHGAKLTKQVSSDKLYPVSSSDGLSNSARYQAQQITNRLRNQEWQHQQRMQAAAENYGWEQQRKKETCDNLYSQKENIISRQRAHNTEWLNEEHRKINDRIYKNGC